MIETPDWQRIQSDHSLLHPTDGTSSDSDGADDGDDSDSGRRQRDLSVLVSC